MTLYTLGFTGKSAEQFFELLLTVNAEKLIDIRINRTSQLSGFTKEKDLEFFLRHLSKLTYEVREDLAPTKDLLSRYRDGLLDWKEYEEKYISLITSRGVLNNISSDDFDRVVLLCSEDSAEECHRRILAEMIVEKYPSLEISHLF